MSPQSRGAKQAEHAEEEEEEDDSTSSGSDSSEDDEEDEDEAETDEAVKAIDKVLRRWVPISKFRIRKCFKAYATTDERGQRGLRLPQATQMVEALSQKLQLPEWLLKDQFDQLFDRFDFDGDGILNFEETQRLVRVGLQQRRVAIAGERRPVPVPAMTLEKAGYTVLKELGRGGQGIIYLATWNQQRTSCYSCTEQLPRPRLEANKKYCVKFYDKQNANACDLGELIAEYSLMKEMKSPAVAKTYEVFQDRAFYYLVCEPYYGGDFAKLARHAHEAGVEMREGWWRELFRQCLSGLAYLHSQAVMHCDIKEQNIMIASSKSYQAPRPILIDFGLVTKFGDVESPVDKEDGPGSPAGTPGYIPPETWRTEVWYPAGDVFSMGVVFFQMLSARIPGVTSDVTGIFQMGDEAVDWERAARERPFPWSEFPSNLPGLRDLIEVLTARDRHERPLAAKATSHPWFHATTDVTLPKETIRNMVTCGEGYHVKEVVSGQLQIMNNLDELRDLRDEATAATEASGGAIGPAHRTLLQQRGVQPEVAASYITACTGPHGVTRFNVMLEESIFARQHYSGHLVTELFDELDRDQTGFLCPSELRGLLDSTAFECPCDDVDDLMEQMDTNKDGRVSFAEFSRVMLEDGRIGRKNQVDKERAERRFPSCTIC